MIAHRLLLIAPLLAGFSFAACGSNSPATPDYCGSPDPCGCVPYDPTQRCAANGNACVCTPVTDEAGPVDGGADDAADGTTDAPAAPDLADFIGEWSPISGTGQSDCGGQVTALPPPNISAVLTFVQSGPDTLTATSSGAYGCILTLVVSGQTATLAQSSEVCAVAAGGSVSFDTFTLVFTPGAPDAGPAIDGGAAVDAGAPNADGGDAGAGSSDAGSTDASVEDAPGTPPSGDAEADGGPAEDASPPNEDAGPVGTLDWQLADTESNCLTTLHYTLVRTP